MVVQFYGHLLYDTRHVIISPPLGKNPDRHVEQNIVKDAGMIKSWPLYNSCGVMGIGSFLLSPVTMSK